MRAQQIYEIQNFTRGGDPYTKLAIGEQYIINDISSADLFNYYYIAHEGTTSWDNYKDDVKYYKEKKIIIDEHCSWHDFYQVEYRDERARVKKAVDDFPGKHFYDANIESEMLWLVSSDIVLPNADPITKHNPHKWTDYYIAEAENFTRGEDPYKKLNIGDSYYKPLHKGSIIKINKNIYRAGNSNTYTLNPDDMNLEVVKTGDFMVYNEEEDGLFKSMNNNNYYSAAFAEFVEAHPEIYIRFEDRITEIQNFTRGGDPYRKLNIGPLRNQIDFNNLPNVGIWKLVAGTSNEDIDDMIVNIYIQNIQYIGIVKNWESNGGEWARNWELGKYMEDFDFAGWLKNNNVFNMIKMNIVDIVLPPSWENLTIIE